MLAKTGNPCSLQAVYKELRGLIAEGIVQKIGKRYALHAPWLFEFQAFAARLAAVAFSDQAEIGRLAGQKKRQSWKFDNFIAANDLWGHIFVYLARHAQRKDILGWNPHSWFQLFNWEREKQFLKSLRVTGNRFHIIVGSDCFLDRWANRIYDQSTTHFSTRPSPFHGDTARYFSVIDDNVITLKLATDTDRRLEQAYRTIKSHEMFLESDMVAFFTTQGHCTLSLERNPKKAAKLRQVFSDYFGVEY